MPTRPLDSLLRLRRQEKAEAERHFANVLSLEVSATACVADAEEALLFEQRKAADPGCDDAVVESFARWLPRGREVLLRAREREREASLDTAFARSAVAMAQASVKAVETIIAERQRSADMIRARHEQQRLDDLWPANSAL
ncbi:flagellar export protein FliJ [Tanticharoenia sakaeratensis]|uniref:Flagellar FliJ protein n=1 Tax=Tanticharoenia sakaeratensis NBRC 103193 TaxID=1231623 RepID=A0A0D6MKY7_9PROT|nr:flagellar export protein FliJ [Tanticharoenia sakaeratensis]GAN54125.1 hypothetical protein Tasa_017_008 [Tanticharoenia sakaeratensis NBRC 103193]GBQ19512.1 hypothetical protein AA103193_1058 [Tanticharoenia sakaeratensis NBRC 103193]